MLELTVKEMFAMVSLHGQDSTRLGLGGQMTGRALAACDVVSDQIDQFGTEAFMNVLKEAVKAAKAISTKNCTKIMQDMYQELHDQNLMEERRSLLASDMINVEAGVDIKDWCAQEQTYRCIVEGFRSEMLEETEPNAECAILFWLFRESCMLNELFSTAEQKEIEQKVVGLAACSSSWKTLHEEKFCDALSGVGLQVLKAKHKLFENPYLEGVTLIFPFLERRNTVFIDLVVVGSSVKDRREKVVEYLTSRGHHVEVVKNGSESLLCIDGSYYRIFPTSRRAYKVPVQGVSLIPVYR